MGKKDDEQANAFNDFGNGSGRRNDQEPRFISPRQGQILNKIMKRNYKSSASQNGEDEEETTEKKRARPDAPHPLKQWAYVLNVRCGENQTDVAEKLNACASEWAKDDNFDVPDNMLPVNQQKVSRAKQQVGEYLEKGGRLTIDAKAVEQLHDKDRPRTIDTDPSEMAERFSDDNRRS